MAKIAACKLDQPYLYQNHLFHRPSQSVTIFCDFDGPIVDVSDRYYSTYQLGLAEVQAVYQAYGTVVTPQVLTKAQFWTMKQERVPDPEIAMRSGLRGQQIELFLERVTQIVNRADLLHQDRLQPGVRWALSLLKAQGVRLVLVTLRQQQQATQLLQQYGLSHFFWQIHGADTDQAAYRNQAEHKAQLLANAMQAVGFNHSQADRAPSLSACMVGDTEADILAGRAMEIPTIALTCGVRSRAYLQRFEPTQIQTDLLSAAHYLIQARRLVA